MKTQTLHHLYERDGATFRRKEGHIGCDEVQNSKGEWIAYTGDGMKPQVFGDYLGTDAPKAQAAA